VAARACRHLPRPPLRPGGLRPAGGR
jgi:hypothetical protein